MGQMNKKVLVVIPDLRYGGTNSSLSNVYNAIKNDYDIDIYPLYNNKIGDYSFQPSIITGSRLLFWFYCYFSDLRGWNKSVAFMMKVCFRLCVILHLDIERIIQKREVKRIQEKRHYDIVIGFQEGAATRFVTLFLDVKKIAWIHCDYVRYHSLINRDEEPIYKGFDKIVCVSKYTSQSFISIYPSLSEKVISVYNIYDQERAIKLAKETIEDFRFDTSSFTILSVGRIDHVKRFSSIPGIARKLYEKGKEFKWYVLGNVVEDDEYKLLKHNIVANSMERHVVLLGGNVNPYPYFAKSDLFVSTSSSEACPIVFLEAQTFNLPIVTTDFGSSSEFIVHGKNGYISSIERIERSIIDVMDGCLQYAPQEIINNNRIVTQLKQEINGLLQ